MIRLTVPSIDEDDLLAVRETLASGYLVQGKTVAAFEQVVADRVGTRYAVAVSNGTAALHLALLALGAKSGDLVVVTAYSWPATANAVELCGAQPVFVDISPNTFNLAPDHLAETLARLSSEPGSVRRIKAILPIHAFGQLADMPAILEIAGRYGIPVIEDAACALAATLNGKPAGSWGVMGCFSFHPRKAVTTGEGGMITTNDPALARTLRMLRNHGIDPDAPAIDFIMPGFNYRLTEFQAALGLTQMAKLDRIVTARRRLAARYTLSLVDSALRPPAVAIGSQPVYQSYVVLLPDVLAPRRAEIIADLKTRGVEATIGTWHMPLIRYYRERYGFKPGDFPATDVAFNGSVTLPLFEGMTEEQQDSVMEGCRAAIAVRTLTQTNVL